MTRELYCCLNGNQIRAWCDLCHRWHFHGNCGKDPALQVVGDSLGHRAAHCTEPMDNRDNSGSWVQPSGGYFLTFDPERAEALETEYKALVADERRQRREAKRAATMRADLRKQNAREEAVQGRSDKVTELMEWQKQRGELQQAIYQAEDAVWKAEDAARVAAPVARERAGKVVDQAEEGLKEKRRALAAHLRRKP